MGSDLCIKHLHSKFATPPSNWPPKCLMTRSDPNATKRPRASAESSFSCDLEIGINHRFPCALSFISNGPEPNRDIFPAFIQTEARLLQFFGNLWHVGRSPGHDEVIRLRKLGLDF